MYHVLWDIQYLVLAIIQDPGLYLSSAAYHAKLRSNTADRGDDFDFLSEPDNTDYK